MQSFDNHSGFLLFALTLKLTLSMKVNGYNFTLTIHQTKFLKIALTSLM